MSDKLQLWTEQNCEQEEVTSDLQPLTKKDLEERIVAHLLRIGIPISSACQSAWDAGYEKGVHDAKMIVRQEFAK